MARYELKWFEQNYYAEDESEYVEVTKVFTNKNQVINWLCDLVPDGAICRRL